MAYNFVDGYYSPFINVSVDPGGFLERIDFPECNELGCKKIIIPLQLEKTYWDDSRDADLQGVYVDFEMFYDRYCFPEVLLNYAKISNYWIRRKGSYYGLKLEFFPHSEVDKFGYRIFPSKTPVEYGLTQGRITEAGNNLVVLRFHGIDLLNEIPIVNYNQYLDNLNVRGIDFDNIIPNANP